MSRYEINPLIPNGSSQPHYCAVGYDSKNRTFFLQVTPHGADKPRHYIGQSRHEYTSLEIFATAARLAGVEFGENLLKQLRADQILSSSPSPDIVRNTFAAEIDAVIDGWTCRSYVTADDFHPGQDAESSENEPRRCVERAGDLAAAILNNIAYWNGLSTIAQAAVRSAAYWSGIDVPVDERFDPAEMILWQSICDGYETDFPLDDSDEAKSSWTAKLHEVSRLVQSEFPSEPNLFMNSVDVSLPNGDAALWTRSHEGYLVGFIYPADRDEQIMLKTDIDTDSVNTSLLALTICGELHQHLNPDDDQQPTETTPRKKPICDECGSDNVMADALVSWNAATGKYEVDNTFDTWQCFDENTCDSNETKVAWVDVNTVITRSAECNDCAAKSDDMEVVGTVCNVCKRGMMSARCSLDGIAAAN
jgi:hypothetical protein